MLQWILGEAGTGKTEHIWQMIRARAEQGGRSLLVVPEQFASTADLTGYLRLGDTLHSLLKVCSFRTLTGKIEDRYGGGALHDISDAGRLVLVRRTLSELGDDITFFRRSRRSARFCADCAETLQQLKYCGVSPQLLQQAAQQNTGARADRLAELARIYAAYEAARKRTGLEPVDRISRAAARVQPDFFEQTACFVDGFAEFTAPEAALLQDMLRWSPQVTVTLCCPDADFSAHPFTVFAPAAATARHLTALAGRCGTPVAPPVILRQPYRFQNEQLRVLARLAAEPAAGEQLPVSPRETAKSAADSEAEQEASGVFCCSAGGIYDEAIYVAARIADLARRGVPYEECAVLCRDTAAYLPALQYAFRLYGIPLFTGSTVSAEYAPMAVFLRAALGLAKNGLTGDGVLALLKTGLCGASESDLSALENYVYTWRPKAEEWRAPFTRNPAGLDAGEPGEEELALLAAAEGLRSRIVPVIEDFRAQRGRTGRELSAALYRLLLAAGARQTVEKWIEQEGARGLGGFDSARMWETVIGFLDEMARLLGDEEVAPAEYDDLLCVLLRAAEIGQAPHTQNEVQLAAADRARLDSPQHVFVMGLNEGAFPAPIGDSPLLTNDDRAQLSEMGAPLSGDFESMVLREEAHLYRAVTAARRSVTLTWPGEKDGAPMTPCAAVQRLMRQMDLRPETPRLERLALTPAAALEQLARHYREDSPAVASLCAALLEEPETAGQVRALEHTAGQQPFAVRETDALRQLLGREMTVSPSRMESYYECRFGYFLQYILGIRPRPRAELGIPQSGILVHWLLENLLREFPALEGLDDAALDGEVRRRIATYAAERLPGQDSRRFTYLLQRIGDNAVRLLRYIRDELAQGGFVPQAMEQDIGHEGGVPAPVLTGRYGEKLRVVGTVDRVDTMTDETGRTWLRVVDYKTGSKTFSLDEVCCGLNTQMLIYLFALTKNGTAQFGNTVPAGVLYLLSDPAPSSSPKKSDFSVEGLIVDDPAVLRATDRDGSGKYLPVSAQKLAGLELLGRISDHLETLLTEMADTLYCGDIAALPLRRGSDHIRCNSCDYRSVCRRRDGDAERTVEKDIWKTVLLPQTEQKTEKEAVLP